MVFSENIFKIKHKMKKAIITGIGGQDGAFLAKLLLDKGYEVYGADRRRVNVEYPHLITLNIKQNIKFVYFDLSEEYQIARLIRDLQPDEFYNLAAMSFVKASFDLPMLTADVDAIGPLRIMEAIRSYSPQTKFYQASTSEMFGLVQETPQNEGTPFYPRSPYGVSKLFAHWMLVNYREAYGLHFSSGILFNHESEFRGEEFVTQKIVKAACNIKAGGQKHLVLGNIDAKRDWGHAEDYVNGMYLMLQKETPGDYVLATGSTVSVREFVEKVFQKLDIPIEWKGQGINEKGYDLNSGELIVRISEDFYRPAEVDLLIGDARKAKRELGWEPKMNLDDIIERMISFQQ